VSTGIDIGTCHAAKELHVQILVRIVAAFVILVLLLLVALPLQLINMLAENEPADEPANGGKPADDLESVEAQPRIRGEATNTR